MKIFRTVIFLSWLVVVLSAAACGTQSASQSGENGSEQTRAEPLTGSAEDFAAYLRKEVANWANIVRTAGIKQD